MLPLKLTIPGHYWDSYIYEGRLYLFGLKGDIRTINWDTLIGTWNIDKSLQLALECAFLRSDFLYGFKMQRMVQDDEVRHIIRQKFQKLGKKTLGISTRRLAKHEVGRQDNPCPFPHSDCELYRRNLYVAAPSGVVRATATGRTKFPISTRVEKKWDAPVHRVSASWGSLALAAGQEGLFELSLDGQYDLEQPFRRFPEPPNVSQQHCMDCNWTFHSIFGSSEQGGFLVSYLKERHNQYEYAHRNFDRIVTSQELWGERGYAWGVQDKLCMATADGIHVLKYQPWEKTPEQRIRSLGIAHTQRWKGKVISASTMPFGVILELDNALVVYPSRGNPITLPGEPVNWRAFPRAKHYENQLHVVWDDRLEIFSFNEDYLVDQDEKILGISVLGSSSKR